MFDVSGDRYDRFMGRYSRPLAGEVARVSGISGGSSVLDVGCGPGALTTVVAAIAGEGNVAGIDPAEKFVEVCQSRLPLADIRQGVAEHLPWPANAFDAAVSQLVVAFMDDAPAGVAEMRRVVRHGGTVTLAMWDADLLEVSTTFWRAATAAGVNLPSGVRLPTTSEPELRALADGAGLESVETTALRVTSTYTNFDEYWDSYSYGVGPIGVFYQTLDDGDRSAVRERCRVLLGDPGGTLTLSATAWAAHGVTPAA